MARIVLIACVMWCGTFTDSAAAQRSTAATITGDRLSGFVLPIEPLAGDISLAALKASAWTVDDTKRLLLQDDVKIAIASYSFVCDRAVVWLNRLPSSEGVINQIAVFCENVRDSTSRAGGSRAAGLSAQGRSLLITASARGEVRLNVALLQDRQPAKSQFVEQAQKRLALHLQRLVVDPPAQLQQRPMVVPGEAKSRIFRTGETPVPPGQGTDEPAAPWLRNPQGLLRFSADRVEIAAASPSQGAAENTIIVTGNIAIEYLADRRDDELPQLTLTAQRAVIFTAPSPLGEMAGQLDASSVRGIYLEGNVNAATGRGGDGAYAVRSPHVFYDFQSGQAIMLDSLLRVQHRALPLGPVYARATEMRQLAENQWRARQVRISTSEFFTPHLALGAQQLIITQQPASPATDESDETTSAQDGAIHIDSRGNTFRVADVPIMYWPRFSGDVEDVPLKSAEVGTRANDGLRLLTTWDLFALTGTDAPDGVQTDLHLDGFTKRGAAAGLDTKYNIDGNLGRVDLYGLYDNGVDRSPAGLDVDPERTWRGVALAEHQSRLSQEWLFQAQGTFISDETFIPAWREDDFRHRREYETSLYLKHQNQNAALSVLGNYQAQGFLANDYLLASRQYAVEKLPELAYRRYGDSLFGSRDGRGSGGSGGVTYSTENRISRMRLAFHRTTPAEIGFRGRAFGIDDDDRIDAMLRARGLRTDFVNRFDTRHELALPMHWGNVNVMPFVVGRLTGYDDDFEAFRAASAGLGGAGSDEDDEARVFASAGLRLSTQLNRVFDDVNNRLFDLHRLRHIVEPYAMLWHGYTTIDQRDLPVYDEEVEALADGSLVQIGVRNTLQTQRGGPGRWRSVDFFTLDTSVVFDIAGVEREDESPAPQFFEYRPEYSRLGDHVRAVGIWLLSDTLALTGDATYVLRDSVLARGSVGAELRHSPVFTTFIEYRYLDLSKNELLAVGWTYQITPKYRLQLAPQWDFRFEEFRAVSMRLTRSFPDFLFTLHLRHDQIRDDTSIGASVDFVKF